MIETIPRLEIRVPERLEICGDNFVCHMQSEPTGVRLRQSMSLIIAPSDALRKNQRLL